MKSNELEASWEAGLEAILGNNAVSRKHEDSERLIGKLQERRSVSA